MLKRPIEITEGGKPRFSIESLGQIQESLQQQLDRIDHRIGSVRQELKEAQVLRAELRRDLDHIKARLSGVPADDLLDERRSKQARSPK